MKAIRIESGVPTVVDVTEPEAGPGKVVVTIEAASICSSDLHLLELGWAEGTVLGHEIAGTTPDGTAVAIEPILSCGGCARCGDGRRHHCGDRELLGVGGAAGGFAERIAVDERCLVPLPAGVAVSDASLVEPLAVGVHAAERLRQSAVVSGRVLVVGAGPIGLATAAALVADGVRVDLVARHEHQAAAGERIGARPLREAGEVPTDAYEVAVDSVASASSVATGIAGLRPEGVLVQVGTVWEPLSLGLDWWTKEIALVPAAFYGGLAPDREIDRAAALLAERPELAEVLATHRFPLDAGTEAFRTAADRSAGTIKVVLEPRS